MRICIFEDHGWSALAPLTLTRPVFELRCGRLTLAQRQQSHFGADETGAFVRPVLADLCQLRRHDWHVNDPGWLLQDSTVLVNARWLPVDCDRAPDPTPHVGLVNGEPAYAVVPANLLDDSWAIPFDEAALLQLQQELRQREVGGTMVRYPWDLVEQNAAALAQDQAAVPEGTNGRAIGVILLGPRDRLHVAESARIEPLAILDTTAGPIFIEDGAAVQSFSRIEGPCSIGPGSTILGARVSGSTIGPSCKIGGEVEASIIQGFSNKAHEGFLGHSYLGEWVNLGAGTQFSDLRNDYHPVNVRIDGERVSTDRLKIGSFVGDFTRTGLNTLFNTGSFVGAFCNLPSASAYLPHFVPSFTALRHGQLQEEDFESALTTARVMMNRRGRELTEAHCTLFRTLFEQTRCTRDLVLRER